MFRVIEPVCKNGEVIENRQFSDSKVLPSGRTVTIKFEEWCTNKRIEYNIYLFVAHKRKQENEVTLQQTGKDGLRALLWAKRKIAEFEKMMIDAQPVFPIFIYCSWDDNRRRNVYEHGLKKIGFNYCMHEGRKVLGKVINATT